MWKDHNNLVSRTDIHGNETLYITDDFSRVKKIISPLGEEQRSYDLLGHVASRIDAGGAKTLFSHTVYGKPYHIVHPEGSEERFEYTLKGLLKKAVSCQGSYRLFTYDYKGRPIQEETYASNGEKIRVIKKVYNAFHLFFRYSSRKNCLQFPWGSDLLYRSIRAYHSHLHGLS